MAGWSSGIVAFGLLAVRALNLQLVVVVLLSDREVVVERVVLRWIVDVGFGVARLPVVLGIGSSVVGMNSTASRSSSHLWENAEPVVRVCPAGRVGAGGGNNSDR